MVTLDSLNAQIRQRADQVKSDFTTDEELSNYISLSAKELFDLLISTDPDFLSVSATAVTTGGASIPLPDDFYRLKGVDVAYTTDTWISVQPFTFAQRNRYSLPSISGSFLWQRRIRYRLLGNSLQLIPTPPAGQTIKLWYVPRPPILTDSGIISPTAQLASGHSLMANGETFMAIPIFGSSVQTDISGVAGTVILGATPVNVSGWQYYTTSSATLSSVPAWTGTHAYVFGDKVVVSGSSNNILVCTVGGTSAGSAPAINSTLGANVSDGGVTWRVIGYGVGYNGSTTTVLKARTDLGAPGSYPVVGTLTNAQAVTRAAYTYTAPSQSGNVFWQSSDPLVSSFSLAEILSSRGVDPTSALYGLTAAAAAGSVTASGRAVTILAASPTLVAPVPSWSPSFDGYGGWEEYVIADVVAKIKIKDEADPAAELALKKDLRERIVKAAQDRDTTGPEVFSDVESSDFWGWSREY
jgi:hypothetical protein